MLSSWCFHIGHGKSEMTHELIMFLICISLFTIFFLPQFNRLLTRLCTKHRPTSPGYRKLWDIVLVASFLLLIVSTSILFIVFTGHTSIIMDGMTKDNVNVGWSTWRREDQHILYSIMAVSYLVFLTSSITFFHVAYRALKLDPPKSSS